MELLFILRQGGGKGGGCGDSRQEDAGMLFERTRRISLKTLRHAEGMCGRDYAADPAILSVLIFLFDHAGKYASMRR
ncbi:MAG: hypothetical protein D3916_18530 [Candidatus Electrothrix sp. MAN1_4]|nr:hypothetical protein [Candidatus Electrothrix sp. MAN1_4]